ncbi:MAG: DUF547 domain-containing protein [Alphaproteobacteria bacterium]|nr:DUF547 domain-containing protein [Alphaproteobacteria bacterium]MBU0834295.1 DUF547 domain-containing protein [Alphaproteobacteria bacterium]MBU1765554.1 DUF547 domain-containing protein [Alphaproteobacteria bacterium]
MKPIHSRLSRRAMLGLAGAGVIAMGARPASASGLAAFAPAGAASLDHTAFDQLLQRYVKPDKSRYNRVDYKSLGRDGAAVLKSYISELSSINPAGLSRNEGHAFWINLYNAKTLEVIIDHYPVASIRDIKLGGGGLFKTGPWSRKIMVVGGVELSLDDVEHEIVRALFKDPMSHYGLNCASYSCPNLAARAYTAGNVDALLAENARDYVNHPRGVTVSDDEITASKIYSWYADDFGGKGALKAHWKSLASADLAQRIDTASVGSFVYDWSLNDV